MSHSADLNGIWGSIDNSLSELPHVPNPWERLRERADFTASKPCKISGIVESKLKSKREGEYYILKNPHTGTYLKLTDRDFFLWNLMDGTRSVKDLVVAYFCEYNSFAFDRVGGLITQLRNSFFLTDRPVNTFDRLREQLARRDFGHRADVFWKLFMNREFPLHNADRYISKAYKSMGWIFLTRPMKLSYLILSGIGAYFFVRLLNSGSYPILRMWNSYGLGFLTILAIYFVIFALHESAHAFTAKFYGRDIRKGGFMIYFGMPAFYVDTTDMWMEPRRARIAVSWAGPYSQLVLGGLCSISAAIFHGTNISPLLFRLAFFSYLSVFINLNPLLELDGYFILMDWLEIPFLRHKSLIFVRKKLWRKILRHEKFSKDEKIFSVFGILAGIWSVCAIGIAIYLWEQRVFGTLATLLEKSLLHKLYLGIVVLTFGVPLLIILVTKLSSVVYTAFIWLADNEHLKTNRNVIALLVGGSVGLTVICFFAPKAGLEVHREILKLIILFCALFFAIKDVACYGGGHLKRTFQFLAAFVLFLFVAELIETIGQWVYGSMGLPISRTVRLLASGLRLGSYSLLLLSMFALAGNNFRLCRLSEQIATLVFLAITGSLLLIAIRWTLRGETWGTYLLSEPSFLIPIALVSLALVLLIPGYFVYQRTEFRTAWLVLAVSLTGISTANILSSYESSGMDPVAGAWAVPFHILSYALLASALFGHYVIYTRVRFAHTPAVREAALRYDDRQRLRSAFANIYEAIFSQFISIYGERVTQYVQNKLNKRARVAGWDLRAAHKKVEDNVPDEFNIISLGEVYRGFLSQMLDLISRAIGKDFVEKAMQSGWDGLYWEEREVADEYLFSPLARGKKLSEEFQKTQKNLLIMLQKMAIFSGLSEREIFLMSSRLQIEKFRKGMDIVKQGDAGDKLYIIKSGEVEVLVRSDDDMERIVAHLGEGDYFGEVALVGDVLRTATCRATTSLEVWALSKRDFNQFVKSHLDLPEKLDSAVATMTMLKRMPLFREFEYKQINMISSMLKSEAIPPQTTIIKQGDPGDAFYIIRSGEVVVTAKSEVEEKIVGRLGAAEYFGEIALVANQPRTATVTSVSETELLRLEKRDFDTVVELISSELEQAGSRRLLDTRRKLKDKPVVEE